MSTPVLNVPDQPHVDLGPLCDPAHPKFHISLGQVVGLAFLALQAYQQQDAAGSPKVLLTPAVAAQYLSGILSVFPR